MRSEGPLVLHGPWIVDERLDSGRLEPLLADWSLPELNVFAVYPHRRFVAPKVRVFVEALRAAFGDGSSDPWRHDASPSRKVPAARKRGAAR